ncbi:sugar-binding protein [Maribacter sp. 2-571]|uniref:sugar-binding protein n=1 Tax=Maribacter sp. 2-571 TaxID=3417569 RepID=UPI003D33B277
MKIFYDYRKIVMVSLITLFTALIGHSQDDTWISLAPGAGGQLQDLYFDPVERNRIYLSSDQEGSYRSDDLGNSWIFIGKDLSHGMSFKIRRDNSNNGRLYQGGLWGAHYSDNRGTNWTRIEETKGDAIASIAFSADNSVKVLGPGWHAKDAQKVQSTIIDPIQPLIGERYVYISKNGGPFLKRQYEPMDGYDHVYNVAIHPANGTIYVGAASGLYISTNDGSNWSRVDNPDGAYRGKEGGVKTLTFFSGEEPNTGKYKFSGGISGMGISPDGERIYAVYQTKGDVPGSRAQWKLFTTETSKLSNADPQWEVLEGLTDALGKLDVQWYNPLVDSKSTANRQRLIIGTNIKDNPNRVGLFEGNLTFGANGRVTSQDWKNTLQAKLKTSSGADAFDEGWEAAKFLSRAYDFTPNTWGPSTSRIIAGGGNNFFLSNNDNNANWPFVAESWLPIYTEKVVGPNDFVTYRNRSFTNTVTYDIATFQDYVIQGNADQGIFESFDAGDSWTKKTSPNEAKNVQSVGITKTSPPIVLAEMRNDFGIPSNTKLFLFARKLGEPIEPISGTDWRFIGGGVNGTQLTNSLPNRQVQVMTIDDKNVSRVYLGFRSVAGVGGIYATEDIEGVYDGESQWKKISNAKMGLEPSFKDIFIDPNDSDVLWASGQNLWRGRRTAIDKWVWEEFETGFGTSGDFESGIKDLFVWDNQGATVVAIAASFNGAPQEVYILKNPGASNWNRTGNLSKAKLDISKTLALRGEVWVEQGETINFNSLAGYKNNIYVGTENGKHKKGLGLFTTKFSLNNQGNVALTNGGWKDWTTDSQGTEFYYARSANADAKIISESNGDVNYYLPTFGIGIWKRQIDSNVPQTDALISSSAVLLENSQNATKEVSIRATGSWSIVNIPAWLEINGSSGSNFNGNGQTTLQFKSKSANPDNLTRSRDLRLNAGGKAVTVTVQQLGTPININLLNGNVNIDGNLENRWNAIPFNTVSEVAKGNPGTLEGRFKIGYTSEKLFIAVAVDDDTPQSNFSEGEPYNGDAVTIALDVNNNKRSGSYGVDDYVFKVTRAGDIIAVNGNTTNLIDDFAVNFNANGYVSEIALAWENLGVLPGGALPIGLEVAIEDSKQGNAVNTIIQFATDNDLNASSPSEWGTAITNGTDVPWLETFDDLFRDTAQDTGRTAWTIEANGLNINDKSFLKVELPDNRDREKKALIARNLGGTATFKSGTIDISNVSERLRITLSARERTKTKVNNGFIKAYYRLNGGARVLFGQLIGDSPVDDTPQILESNAIASGNNTLEIEIDVNSSSATTNHIIDNILVEPVSAPRCKKLSDLAVVKIEKGVATVSWTDALSNGTEYVAQYRGLNSNGPWLSLLPISTDITSAKTPFLARGNSYEWRVRKRCGNTETEFALGANFTILGGDTGAETILFREEFEKSGCSTSSNAQRRISTYPCYTNNAPIAFSGNGSLRTSGANADYEGASNQFSVLLNANTNNNPKDKSITIGGISVAGAQELKLRFGLKQDALTSNSEGLIVEYRAGASGGNWSNVPISLPSNADWTLVETTISGVSATSDLELRFTAKVGSKYRLDDVQLSSGGDAVECSSISNIASSGGSDTSETLTWNATGSPSSFEVRIKLINTEGWLVTAVDGPTETFDNLTNGGTYIVQIRAICGSESKSFWSPAAEIEYTFVAGANNNNTDPSESTIFFAETFDAANAPCTVIGGNLETYGCYSEAANATFTGSGAINDSANNASENDYPGPSNGNNLFLARSGKTLEIKNIDASNFDAITLSFGLRKNNVDADGATLIVEITENGGNSWTAVPLSLPTNGSSNDWIQVTLETGVDRSADFGVRFRNTSTFAPIDRFRLDDIRLSGIPVSGSQLKANSGTTVANELLVYPNPTSDVLNITVFDAFGKPDSGIDQIMIYDMMGRLVLSHTPKNASSGNLSLPVGTLSKGYYVLKIQSKTITSDERLFQVK